MSNQDPIPGWFGPRYLLWLAWSNAITILAALQGALAAVLLAADGDPAHPLLAHETVRWIVLGNAVLTGLVAQLKRNNPPSPPPSRSAPAGPPPT